MPEMTAGTLWLLMIAGGFGQSAVVAVETFPTQVACEAAGAELDAFTMHIDREHDEWKCVPIPSGVQEAVQ